MHRDSSLREMLHCVRDRSARQFDVRYGSKADIECRPLMSALPPKADIAERQLDVRFVPEAGIAGQHLDVR